MTRFDRVTRDIEALAELLEQVQDDALEAEGCSMKLKLPDAEVYMDWREWLKQEVREDV